MIAFTSDVKIVIIDLSTFDLDDSPIVIPGIFDTIKKLYAEGVIVYLKIASISFTDLMPITRCYTQPEEQVFSSAKYDGTRIDIQDTDNVYYSRAIN